MSDRRSFRWQGLFQNAAEPLFVLDSRRRLRFVNAAFETLAGVPAERLRGLPCRSRSAPGGDALVEDVIAHLLTPPKEVLAGVFGRVRRLVHDRSGRVPANPPAWWDVEFLPFRQGEAEEGRLVLGRVIPVASGPTPAVILPERLVALRQAVVGRYGFELLQSKHAGMVRVASQVRLAMEVRSPVLFLGEAGTGKRSIARLIHYQGRQRESAFAMLDCERLPAEVLAEMLLGSSARNEVGTIYLHQPGNLPRELQQMLSQRLTADRPGPRLMAGTTSPVADLIREGRMLAELAGLLSPIAVELPPLRQRLDDLPGLVERMLARLNEDAQPIPALTPAAWELLCGYRWPGNLAELFAVLGESRCRVSTGRIDAGDFPMQLRLAQEPGPMPRQQPPLPELLEQVEKRLIAVALRRAGGNRSKAAEMLGIYRSRLLRRMEALGLGDPSEGEGDS